MRTTQLRKPYRNTLVGLLSAFCMLGVPLSAANIATAAEAVQAQRTEEPVWVTEPWRFDVSIGNHRPGATEYNFLVDGIEHGRFELYFGQALNGAKVDVWAYTNTGTLWMWHEQRVIDNEVDVRWDGPRVHTIVVRVHHHTRREPTVQRFHLIHPAPIKAASPPRGRSCADCIS